MNDSTTDTDRATGGSDTTGSGMTDSDIADSDIAVVGMACRFPGADSVEAFWDVLHEGRETLTHFTDDQLRAAGVPEELFTDVRYVRAGQVIEGAELFDAELFRVPRDEAEMLDPQHRVFLEVAAEALERSGHDPARSDAQIGVFAGAGMNTYLLHNLGERYRTASPVERYRLMLTNEKDFLSTRVSYKLDLRGPSVNVNTACSTSLVAVHTACLSLIAGECDMAVTGAVHLAVPQETGHLHQEGMIFSPDGHCRAFDAKSQGTVIGNGAGAVVLKPLRRAVADGDWVHAVIKGSAINNDGAAKTGYTAPGVAGQRAVIADAQHVAGVGPDTIGYVEAHGTGTVLGDPIEVQALTEAFREGTERTGFCGLGSVKSNLGHLDTAAGMAGLIKTVLMLEHATFVPSLHLSTPNPEIDFDATPFVVGTTTAPWPAGDTPRRAGVSSFGIGGTNAHVVLQEAPPRPAVPDTRTPELLVLSARSADGLTRSTARLARHLRGRHRDLELGAVARTLGTGRRAHPHRTAVVADGVRDAAKALAIGDPDRVHRGEAGDRPDRPVLVLDGTPPTPADTADLLRSVPAYRAAAEEFAGGPADTVPADGSPVAAATHGYALAATLTGWGVVPSGYAGRGAGLAAVAALTGALDPAAARALAAGTAPATATAPSSPVLVPGEPDWLDPARAADPALWAADGELTGLDRVTGDGSPAVALTPPDGSGSGVAFLLGLAAARWVRGAELDLGAVLEGGPDRRVPLPPTPFERQRYWVDPDAGTAPEPAAPGHRLVDRFDPADPARSVGLITAFVLAEIGAVVGEDTVDLDANLFDIGMESLLLIEIVAKLGDQVAVPIAATSFVEHPTVRAFVAHVAEQLGLPTGTARTDRARGRTSRRARRATERG